MLSRRHLLTAFACALALGATLSFSSLAGAMSGQAYDQKAFDMAQLSGKSILLHVTAPWCPTCKAQTPILGKLESLPKFQPLVVFNIDFDTSKELLRKLKVNQQSTMIVFKGKDEVGRATGDTNAASIEALLAKAI